MSIDIDHNTKSHARKPNAVLLETVRQDNFWSKVKLLPTASLDGINMKLNFNCVSEGKLRDHGVRRDIEKYVNAFAAFR